MTTIFVILSIVFSIVALLMSTLSIMVARNIDARLRKTIQQLDLLDKDLRG
jgi:uncharacterized membrane protein YhaH (DUF805 family)